MLGNRVKVRVVKNKVAPFRVAEFDILYDEGISSEGGLLDRGVELGLIKKAGAFPSYGGTRLGQGPENGRDFLKFHRETAQDIDGRIRRQILTGHPFQPQTPVVDTPVQAEDAAEIATLDTASSADRTVSAGLSEAGRQQVV